MLGAAAKRFNFKPSCSSSDIRKVGLMISTTNLCRRQSGTDKWALPYIERRMTARMGATTMRQWFDLARNAFLNTLCHQNGR
jgi:hypothetical protein